MKKRHLTIMGIAIIFILCGGIGSGIFYKRLSDEKAASEVQKKFKYDQSDHLVLNFKNGSNVNLSYSGDDYIRMNKSGLNFDSSSKENTTWEIEKKEQTTTVTIDNKINEQKIEPRFFDFGSITDDTIYLTLPDGYKSVTLKGDNLNVYASDLTLDAFTVTNKKGDISLSSINSKDLTAITKYGYVDVNHTKVEHTLTLESGTGSIYYKDANAKEALITSKSGDILTGNTKGDLTIKNQHGTTNINHVAGKVNVENKNNDITFHSNSIKNDVDLSTIHGDITVEVDKPSYKELKKDFETINGVIEIFNENLSSDTEFKENKGNKLLLIRSKNGNITVDELDEDDTHYED